MPIQSDSDLCPLIGLHPVSSASWISFQELLLLLLLPLSRVFRIICLKQSTCWGLQFCSYIISMVQQPPVGQDFLSIPVLPSHSDTPHSIGLLWARVQTDTQTTSWLHKTLTINRHSYPRRDSNPQLQQASGRTHATGISAAVLLLQFMIHIVLFPMFNVCTFT
jgi:hypothetical protein